MNCQECELILAGENQEAAEGHLAGCASCRALQKDLIANAEALRSLHDDELPRFRPVPARPLRWGWRVGWAVAAAAALVLAFGLHERRRMEPVRVAIATPILESPRIARHSLEQPRRSRQPARGRRKAVPGLTVKMLTPDPDVVIYWIVEPKEGAQE